MFKTLQAIAESFRPLFPYQKTYACFVLVLLGFMLRLDHYGVSSSIRWLGLSPNVYDALIHFFHSSAWNLDHVMSHWLQWCRRSFPLVTVEQRLVLLGDHIKVPKEAVRQPGVVKLYQDSGNSGKPKRFWGHHFGTVAVLAGSEKKYFAVPCLSALHEGVNPFRQCQEPTPKARQTLVTRMIELLIITAIKLDCPGYAILDAYFSTGPAFKGAQAGKRPDDTPWIHLIVAAKRHFVAYESAQAARTEKIKLWTLFDQRSQFTSIRHPAHARSIQYRHRTLFWKPAGACLSFVWIMDQGRCWLLMGSDLNLDPVEMIRLYTRRSKIEVLFWTLTQVIGAFGYRFWSQALPKLNKNKSRSGTQPIPTSVWEQVLPTLKAIESFVNIACIATAILQYLALTHTRQIWVAHQATAWLRSYSSSVPSEQVVQRVIQARFFVGRQDKSLAWLRRAIHQANQPQRLNPRKVPKHPTLTPPDPPDTLS